MKKIFSLILVVIMHWAHSQDFVDLAAQEICECVQSKDNDEKSRSQLEVQIGICMMETISTHPKEFEEYTNGKSLSELDFKNLGTEVGVRMVSYCPMFFANFIKNESVDNVSKGNSTELFTEKGIITSLKSNQFNMIHLKTEDGSLLKFMWLTDFEGAEILMKEQYKNKSVSIYYDNFEFYDPKSKSYIKHRVIYGLEINE